MIILKIDDGVSIRSDTYPPVIKARQYFKDIASKELNWFFLHDFEAQLLELAVKLFCEKHLNKKIDKKIIIIGDENEVLQNKK